MQPSKPQASIAFLFVLLTLSFIQFTPQSIHNEQPVVQPLATLPPPPAILQAQTGGNDSLDAIVPLERLDRQLPVRSEPSAPAGSDLLLAAEELEFPPDVQNFIDEVTDGNPDMVRGVHVPDVLTLPVIQQPQKNPAYVSEENDVVTQFQSAAHYGITGLLAHNYLAGGLFYNIHIGQDVIIVMGDGATRQYRVTGIHRYKKISPSNLRSILIDLEDGKTFTTSQVFSQFYRGDPKVTFQTCLEGEGILNWGLTFFVAEPVDS